MSAAGALAQAAATALLCPCQVLARSGHDGRITIAIAAVITRYTIAVVD
jgi:hypothetical protein